MLGDTPRAMADALLDKLFADHPELEEYLLDHLEILEAEQ